MQAELVLPMQFLMREVPLYRENAYYPAIQQAVRDTRLWVGDIRLWVGPE